ncbi:DMT family transporter [Streptomyces sp. WMMB 322]|uniref:DMT family transporter n=1 Tax=Streptomyces sp. WMMB 322 TaxID=1286821 RepID=UPI0006E15829|nr:DMT family transporter [Streptomyces sp. WMMB 322]
MASTEKAGEAAAPAAQGEAAERRWRGVRPGPALMVVAGAACTSSSGMFIKLSEVNAGTAAFLRCALALVVLAPMAFVEYRRVGPRRPRLLALDLAAGALLGLDYVCWVQSIHDLGASIATLLLNIQLVVFPLLARFLTGVRLARRFWLTASVLLTGLALAGGAIGRAEPGSDPVSGVLFGTVAGMAFAGYLFLIRLGGDGRPAGTSQLPSAASPEETGRTSGPARGCPTDLRGSASGVRRMGPPPRKRGDASQGGGAPSYRGSPCRRPGEYSGDPDNAGGTARRSQGERCGAWGHPRTKSRGRREPAKIRRTGPGTSRGAGGPHTVTPVCTATFAAAVAAGVLGSLWTGVDLDPGPAAWGWLIPMAFLGQVLAWLLINPALPRLSPDKGATLLLLQPILALLFGVGFLAERPTPTQYAGCVLVVLAVWRTTRTDH